MATKKRLPSDAPGLEELRECLNGEPPNTGFYDNQDALITGLYNLCVLHGFGATSQCAAWIEDLWRNPEKEKDFKRQAKARRKMMLEAIETIKANPR